MNNEQQTQLAFPKERSHNRRSKKVLLLLGLSGTIVLGVSSWLLGTAIGFFDAQSGTKRIDGLTPFVLLALLAFGLAAGLAWNIKFWRTIDEAARRAHLDAFYWGGSISWMVLAPFVVLPQKINGFKLPLIDSLNMTASQLFGLGIMTTIFVTLMGYGIAWLIWWASKR